MKKESLSYVINLASEEYAKVVQFDQLDYPVIKIDFKDFKNGQYKIIGVNAKRARGAMTSLIIKRDVHHIEEIKSLHLEVILSTKISLLNLILFLLNNF